MGRSSATTARIASDLLVHSGAVIGTGCYRVLAGSGSHRSGLLATAIWRPAQSWKKRCSKIRRALPGRAPIFLAKFRAVVVAERAGQPCVLLPVEGDRIVGAGGLQEQAVADLGAQSIGRGQVLGLAQGNDAHLRQPVEGFEGAMWSAGPGAGARAEAARAVPGIRCR